MDVENPGSWVALAIVLTSILTAWALNYSAPKVRVFGTCLAALGCFAVRCLVSLFCCELWVIRKSKA